MRFVVALLLAVGVLAGCGAGVQRTPDQSEVVAAAVTFGHLVIPPDVEVLEASAELRGMDDAYRLALKTNPAGAEQLLADSGLGVGEDPNDHVDYTPAPIAGPAYQIGPGVQSWQQPFMPTSGHQIYRAVTVDSRAAPVVYVHLLLFET